MSAELIAIAIEIAKYHEGLSLTPYVCPAGMLTVGYGHNLQAKGITNEVADLMLKQDMDDAVKKASSYAWFSGLDHVRRAIIVDMCFNMGSIDDWKNFQAALVAKDWKSARASMENSRWYGQVGRRAKNLCEAMTSGEWKAIY